MDLFPAMCSKKSEIHPNNKEISMREIFDFHHPKRQGQPNGNQRKTPPIRIPLISACK